MIKKVNIPAGTKGDWEIQKFSINKEQTRFANIRMMFAGHSERAVNPGDYTGLYHTQRGIIMSDTPAEMRDHRSIAYYAKGHVLVNGLGLGVIINSILEKPEVTQVTVIEIEKDVIDLVGTFYKEKFKDKLEIIHCSAFDYIPPKGIQYDCVWHDIWDSICTDNWEEYKKLHRKYGKRCDWQGSWGRSEIQRMLREEKNEYYTPWK